MPPEIRIKIYDLLLSPHARHRERSFAPSLRSYNTIAKLYPSILRVSNLIYIETHPILYDTNTLILDLRSEFFGNVRAINATQWRSNTSEQRLVLIRGGIYQQGLQHVRHVQIKVDEQALWTESFRKNRFTVGKLATPPFSPAANILTSLLVCLSEGSDVEEVEMDKKTLKLQFKIQPDERGGHVLEGFIGGEHDEVRPVMMYILRLVKAVEPRRDVEVELELKQTGDAKAKIDLLRLDLN